MRTAYKLKFIFINSRESVYKKLKIGIKTHRDFYIKNAKIPKLIVTAERKNAAKNNNSKWI